MMLQSRGGFLVHAYLVTVVLLVEVGAVKVAQLAEHAFAVTLEQGHGIRFGTTTLVTVAITRWLQQ
jgi:hypothetical protein